MSNASFSEIGKAAERCRKMRYPGGKSSFFFHPPPHRSKVRAQTSESFLPQSMYGSVICERKAVRFPIPESPLPA